MAYERRRRCVHLLGPFLFVKVNILHKDLVHWITQSLLSLAPDHKGLSEEAKEQRILHSMTTFELQDRASTLAKQLSDFSSYLSKFVHILIQVNLIILNILFTKQPTKITNHSSVRFNV